MATTPPKPLPTFPPPLNASTSAPKSPRITRPLRKLQSAQALSSHYSATTTPSLAPPQRQLQHHRSSAVLRDHATAPQINPLPVIAPLPPAQPPTRSRSNSDIALTVTANSSVTAKRSVNGNKKVPGSTGSTIPIDTLVRQGPKGELAANLALLRRAVLLDGLEADTDGMSQHRIYIWLIFLNAAPIPTETYLSLIHRGPSPAYAKIRNDTFRTLATDPLFKRRVSEASLIRLLNALAWTLHDDKHKPPPTLPTLHPPPPSTSSTCFPPGTATATSTTTLPSSSSAAASTAGTEPGIYVQGMNVLCAPLLYAARSEAEAFVLTRTLLTAHLPAYIHGAMPGVHRGLALVDKSLALIDAKLYHHLAAKNLHAEIYAFPSVLTLCACTPPLPEVLMLWDFLFAYGPHLNVLAIVAQLVLMREDVLASRSPGKLLRGLPPLRANVVVEMAVSFVTCIPKELYDEIVVHAR